MYPSRFLAYINISHNIFYKICISVYKAAANLEILRSTNDERIMPNILYRLLQAIYHSSEPIFSKFTMPKLSKWFQVSTSKLLELLNPLNLKEMNQSSKYSQYELRYANSHLYLQCFLVTSSLLDLLYLSIIWNNEIVLSCSVLHESSDHIYQMINHDWVCLLYSIKSRWIMYVYNQIKQRNEKIQVLPEIISGWRKISVFALVWTIRSFSTFYVSWSIPLLQARC